MGERKVLNMYIPPDFDPSRVPRGKRDAKNTCSITMMMPFSAQCNTCSHFMYKGTKFNAKKEDVVGRDYLGVRIFRFIGKCSACNAWFSFITDPEHMDFAAERGITRNFEPWREERAQRDAEKAEREALEADAMGSLEARTLESKRAMEVLDALEELSSARRRQAGLTTDDLMNVISAPVREAAAGVAAAEAASEAADRERAHTHAAAQAFAQARAAAAKQAKGTSSARVGILAVPRMVPMVRKPVAAAPPAAVTVLTHTHTHTPTQEAGPEAPTEQTAASTAGMKRQRDATDVVQSEPAAPDAAVTPPGERKRPLLVDYSSEDE